jgi:L-threonylcarbamoyladenylate synthase
MTVETATRVLTADRTAIAAAARCLADGGLVAFPTETVYGLGADATNGAAVARLYAAKSRPRFNPLIAHVGDLDAARDLAQFDAAAERLAALWPGPLTLVLPKASSCPVADLATAGLDTIAVRVPDHPVARDLLAAFGKPVVAPSANRSGHVSPTTAQHVIADLDGRIDMVIDGGPTSVGVESTIVACFGGQAMLLRPGGVARTRIEQVLGAPLADAQPTSSDPSDDDVPLAPGQLASHYAPRARLRLNAERLHAGEVLLAFGPVLPAGADGGVMRNLSPAGDVVEAAANLFSHLRALDTSGAATIAVMPIPEDSLGEAINDRLRRAASPR